MCYKGLQIFLPFGYDWLDGKWLGHSLRKGEKERVALRDKVLAEGIEMRGWRPSKWGMIIVMSELTALTVAAWAVSLTYLALVGSKPFQLWYLKLMDVRCTLSSPWASSRKRVRDLHMLN